MRFWLLFLILVSALENVQASCAEAANPPQDRQNGMWVGRGKWDYGRTLTPEGTQPLETRVKSLKKGEALLDQGTGNGNFLLQAAEVVADGVQLYGVALEKPPHAALDKALKENPNLHYKEGDVVSLWRAGRLPRGFFKLITDMFGAGTYTENLAQLIEVDGHLLAPGGRLLMYLHIRSDYYTYTQDSAIHSFEFRNLFETEDNLISPRLEQDMQYMYDLEENRGYLQKKIRKEDTEKIFAQMKEAILTWGRGFQGLRIVDAHTSTAYENGEGLTLEIERTTGLIIVPPLLQKGDNGTPPSRSFTVPKASYKTF